MPRYSLGPVKPHVAAAANEIGTKFGVATVYGFGAREGVSDHPLGLALDFMTNTAQGDAVAGYAQANANRLGITYIIWKQRIWSTGRAGDGWRLMEDRGSATANHYDHVHVSFSATGAGGGTVPITGPDILIPPGWGWQDDAVEGIAPLLAAFAFITDKNGWIRVAMFIGGGVLLLIGLGMLGKAQMIAGKAVKGVTNARP